MQKIITQPITQQADVILFIGFRLCKCCIPIQIRGATSNICVSGQNRSPSETYHIIITGTTYMYIYMYIMYILDIRFM